MVERYARLAYSTIFAHLQLTNYPVILDEGYPPASLLGFAIRDRRLLCTIQPSKHGRLCSEDGTLP